MKSPGKPLVIEIEGKAWLFRGRNASPLEHATQPKGDLWVVSDFGGEEPRIQDVEVPAKFAPGLLQRRLRDSGDYATPPQILAHWVQSVGSTASRLFFTAVDSPIFNSYASGLTRKRGHSLLFSANALLLAVQRYYSRGDGVAVFFLHGRHIDLVVGEGQRVVAVSRLAVYSQDRLAVAGLVDSLANELRAIEGEHNLKVGHVVGLLWGVTNSQRGDKAEASALDIGEINADDASLSSADWPLFPVWIDDLEKRLGRRVTFPEIKSYALPDGGTVVSSLPSVCGVLGVGYAANSTMEKHLYRAHLVVPWAAMATVAAVGAVFWLYSFNASEANHLEAEAQAIIKLIGQEMPKAQQPFVSAQFDKDVAFGNLLLDLRQSRHFSRVLVDITGASGKDMQLGRVDLKYKLGSITVTLNGRFRASFEAASISHRQFIAKLEELGYRLVTATSEGLLNEVRFSMVLKLGDET